MTLTMNDTQSKATDPLRPIAGPELFFGLIGPIGTDLNLVAELL